MIKVGQTYKGKHGYWYQLGICDSGNWQVWASLTEKVKQNFTVCSKTPAYKQEAIDFMQKLLDNDKTNAILSK
jgi:hypothetical protein